MATHLTVPGDIEPTSLGDLVSDCRELAGAVASLGATTARLARIPLARRSDAQPSVQITNDAAGALDGYADYGS